MEVTLVKNADGGTWHRAWVTQPDGTATSAKVFLPHDLDHFVIESALGLAHGFWGIFVSGGWRRQSQLSTARDPRRAAVALAQLDDPLVRHHAADALLAEAAVSAIGNMFGDGPDTLEGVRERLRHHDDARLGAIADDLDDGGLTAIYQERSRLLDEWQALEPGGTLQLTWPLEG